MSLTGIRADEAILLAGPLMLLIAHFFFAPFNTAYKVAFSGKRPSLADILRAQWASQSEKLGVRIPAHAVAVLMFYLSYQQDSAFVIVGITITIALAGTSSVLHYRRYVTFQGAA